MSNPLHLRDPMRTLATGFMRSAQRFPERPALEVAGTMLDYRTLRRLALQLAGAIRRSDSNGGPP
jgi:acyl-CoA synthetase (AMP-forming)/AMP-acid ligase II